MLSRNWFALRVIVGRDFCWSACSATRRITLFAVAWIVARDAAAVACSLAGVSGAGR